MMEEYQILDRLLQFGYNREDWVSTLEFQQRNSDIEFSHETLVYLLTKLRLDGYIHVNPQTENEYAYFLKEPGKVFIFEGGYSKKEEDRLKKEKYEYEKYFLEVEALRGQISKFRFDRMTTRASIIISIISILIAIIALYYSSKL